MPVHQTYESNRAASFRRIGVDVAFDVGANRGQYAASLREFGYGGKIISFEPLPDAYADLAARFRGDPCWVGINAACGRTKGVAEFNVSSDSACSSMLSPTDVLLTSLPGARTIRKIPVDVLSLDEYCAEIELDEKKLALKVDVQGFEREVLAGATDLLAAATVVELELAIQSTYQDNYALVDAIPEITRLGFDVVSIGRGYSDVDTGCLLDIDVLFERRASQSEARELHKQ